MKAAIYTRVSTEGQADEGYSLSAQLNLIKEYCDKNNIIPVAHYSDEGLSGQKEDRPEFQRMIKDAEKGLFNIILVHKFDRFARKVEISQKVKNRLKKASVNVISITEPIEDSPIGFFQEGLLDLLSEYFIRNLSKEVKKGLTERAKQGWHNGWLPYGYYSKRDGKAYIKEDEANIVRKIFEMYNAGAGYIKIARWLNANGIPTQTGKRWSHYQVDRILQNVKYAGMIYYDGNIYESKIEPIVSKDIFEAAQISRGIRAEKQKHYYRGSNFGKFLFLGYFVCSCGRNMRVNITRKPNRKNINYYVCSYAQRCIGDGKCDVRRYFNTEKFEKYILDEIQRVANSVDTDIKVYESNPLTVSFEDRSKKIKNELNRAKQAYLDEVFNLDEYKEIKKRLESELQEIETYNSANNKNNNVEFIKEKVKKALKDISTIDDIPAKKTILMNIIQKIVAHEDKVEIIYRL